jgi:hypothetical protein
MPMAASTTDATPNDAQAMGPLRLEHRRVAHRTLDQRKMA